MKFFKFLRLFQNYQIIKLFFINSTLTLRNVVLVFLVMFLEFRTEVAWADGGIGYKGIKLNVAGTQTWYKAHDVSWGYNSYQFNSASNFPTSSLASLTGSQVLQITGYAVVGWTDNADYVAGRLQYKVWRNTASEPSTWSTLDVGNYGNNAAGAANVVCSNGNDRVVGRDDFSTNINPGTPGTYNLISKFRP